MTLRQALGYPDRHYNTIHVGGTNGKGSVSAKIAKGLQLAGKKVGLFTSPHLVTFEERFQINGVPISPDRVAAGLDRLSALPYAPTFFEQSFALALHLFREASVDDAVIEVGMGGRLDATNVIEPILSVITSVGFDHTEHLGVTLEEIAKEKGGIVKPGVPLILGPSAQNLGLEQLTACRLVRGEFADFREENRAIARAALEELGVPNEEALTAELPGRFQDFSYQGGTLLFDVAHNPTALDRLFQLVMATFPHLKRRVVAGFTEGPDVQKMVEMCRNRSDRLTLVNLSCHKAAFIEGAAPYPQGWKQAFGEWEPASELLILCGSCYLAPLFFESIKNLAKSVG